MLQQHLRPARTRGLFCAPEKESYRTDELIDKNSIV
jgi:hypothetical protein